MIGFSIADLKKHLGPGLGLRKNKYLLEIPLPGIEGAKINVLARSAGLPERTITTSNIHHKGRQYNLRAETDYGGTYEVSIVDDSDMAIRKQFDEWMRLVDDSKPASAGLFSGSSYEAGIGQAIDAIKSGAALGKSLEDIARNPVSELGGFLTGQIDAGVARAIPKYQTDINIWQLSANSEKVYGYKLQNAFPSQMGIVTLDDGDPDTLSEFSIQFTFSEFIPLEGLSIGDNLLGALLGDDVGNIVKGLQ